MKKKRKHDPVPESIATAPVILPRPLDSSPEPAPAAFAPRGPSPWRTGGGLALFCLLLYLANGRTVPLSQGWDTIPNRIIPFSILRFGTVTLEPFRDAFRTAGGYREYVQERHGTLVSFFPIGASVVALPVYVPVFLWKLVTGHASAGDLLAATAGTEKAASAVIAALSVGLIYLALLRRTNPRRALLTAAAFGLGSVMWPVASQQLWQHGPAVACLAAGVLLLDSADGFARISGSGAALAFLFIIRPPTAVFWLAGLAFVFFSAKGKSERFRRVATFAWPAAVIWLPVLLYNEKYYGTLLGGYSRLSNGFIRPQAIPAGLAGLLLSPNRGLVVFSPIVVIAFLGVAQVLRRNSDTVLKPFVIAAIAYVLIHASYAEWAAGWSFGPRYLIEILPVLALASASVELGPRWKRPLVVLGAVSVCVQLCGAFTSSASAWNARMSPHLESAAWSFRHIMVLEDLNAWLGGSAPPMALPSKFASREAQIASTTPVIVPGATLQVIAPGRGRAVVTGVFDATLLSGDGAIVIGKLRVNGKEQPGVAIYSPGQVGARSTFSQEWTIDLFPGSACNLALWAQLNRNDSGRFVVNTNTSLSALVQPAP